MPRKTTKYFYTSVPNALFKEPEQRKEITKIYFEEILPKYDVFVSELVVAEIDAIPDNAFREKILATIKEFTVLSISSQAEQVAREYLKYLKIPWRDALHIAIASIEGMAYLVTWNMTHIAKEKTRRIVDNINCIKGNYRLYIVTPRDFTD